jgi:hypothetical protein
VRWHINVIYVICGLILGFTLNGLFFNGFSVLKPILIIDNALDIGDILTILTTLILAIYIPYSIGRIIDKEKQFKIFAFDNAKIILNMLEELHSLFESLYDTNEQIGKRNSNKIYLTAIRIEEKIRVLINTVNKIDSKDTEIKNLLYDVYLPYWRFMTSEIANEKNNVTPIIFEKFSLMNFNFENIINEVIHKINNL